MLFHGEFTFNKEHILKVSHAIISPTCAKITRLHGKLPHLFVARLFLEAHQNFIVNKYKTFSHNTMIMREFDRGG
jgi:hypothetical protein